jgi:hypothetical protein
VFLHGCAEVLISDPDLWPRDFVQKDVLQPLVGKHEEEVLENLGFPAYVVKRGHTVSYLYQDVDDDTSVLIWPVVFVPYKGHEVRCVLLSFNRDGFLKTYEIESEGAVAGFYGMSSCADLFGISSSELIDPALYIAIDGEYGVIEQYRWYTARPPNDPSRLPYLCRAADGGHPNAQIEVGRHFAQGVGGGPSDPRRAYVWYSLARKGFPDAPQLQLLMERMIPEEIAEAEEMLANWKRGQCEQELIRRQLDD